MPVVRERTLDIEDNDTTSSLSLKTEGYMREARDDQTSIQIIFILYHRGRIADRF